MKFYVVTLVVRDSDELGPEDIKSTLENQKYPNRCIHPYVSQITGYDVGEWHDDHPLNRAGVNKIKYLAMNCETIYEDNRNVR